MRLLLAFFFLVISNVSTPNTIEYGGISFECDYDCGDPEYDRNAARVVNIFSETIEKIFKRKVNLYDGQGSWKEFSAYEVEEDAPVFCEINRYRWELTDGRYIPDLQNFQFQIFPVTHTDLNHAFSVVRNDLSFYETAREGHFEKLIKLHRRNLKNIHALKGKGCTGIDYDKETERVLSGGWWSDPGSCFLDNCDGTYSCSIREAIQQEENGIANAEEEITIRSPFEKSFRLVDKAHTEINEILKEIFTYCLQKHQPEGLAFNAAIESLLLGNFFDALEHIQSLLEIAETHHFDQKIIAKIHFLKGQLESEGALYGDAVLSLTNAIARDPLLKDAYLERACAYFELGNFDLSLEDYLASGRKPELVIHHSPELFNFSLGLTEGILKGSVEASIDFVPSLLSSIHGIGHGLWALALDPIRVSKEFIEASSACIDFIKNNVTKERWVQLVPELEKSLKDWDKIDGKTKGEIIGQVIGKYGVDIFGGTGLLKGVKVYKELKRANNILTLESMALSKRHNALIQAEAVNKYKNRQAVLQKANLQIEWNKQGKHLEGHNNFQVGRSIIEHADPQRLVHRFAGTGIREINQIPGSPGYKEVIDFGEFIGYHVEQISGKRTPTTWGKIHYSKNGVHIVPTYPKRSSLEGGIK